MKFKNKNFSKGFTLTELLLVMAIIAILAGVILVGLSSQRDKANQGKVLMELSGIIQPIMMCKSDGGQISNPTSGDSICQGLTGADGYGKWPNLPEGFGDYETYGDLDTASWGFSAANSKVKICCNGNVSGCQELTKDEACSESIP